MRSSRVIVALALFFLLALTAWFAVKNPDYFSIPFQKASSGNHRHILIGNTPVFVEVADTERARVEGLSGRGALPEGTGLLMAFDTDGMYGIWMKDMKFAIDIIWLNQSGTVVTVASSVGPETYPTVFYPQGPSRYVLEVPAGFADTHNIQAGGKVSL